MLDALSEAECRTNLGDIEAQEREDFIERKAEKVPVPEKLDAILKETLPASIWLMRAKIKQKDCSCILE